MRHRRTWTQCHWPESERASAVRPQLAQCTDQVARWHPDAGHSRLQSSCSPIQFAKCTRFHAPLAQRWSPSCSMPPASCKFTGTATGNSVQCASLVIPHLRLHLARQSAVHRNASPLAALGAVSTVAAASHFIWNRLKGPTAVSALFSSARHEQSRLSALGQAQDELPFGWPVRFNIHNTESKTAASGCVSQWRWL